MYEQFGLMAGAFAAALALLMMRHQPGDGAAPAGPPEPGDEGPKPQPPIPPDELVILKGAVVDAETGRPAPCRVHIEDAEGRYCAPEGHQFISGEKIYTTGVDDEPDIVNRSHIWAMLPDGNFTVRLRAADGYSVQLEHGLEYDRAVETVDLANDAGKAIERTFQMARGIDMRAAGWMAADTHVHNLTPGETARQMPIEGIDYVNLMFIGPDHPLWVAGLLTGKPDPASTEDRIVFVSQEVRDADLGHLTLLGMRNPIEPIRSYTGREDVSEKDPSRPPLPNEPLNWEVYELMHDQDGLAFHAHYLFWPGRGSAVCAALAKLDGVEWCNPEVVKRGDHTHMSFPVEGYGPASGAKVYYDMLNCGARLPLIGGTDKMSAWRAIGGTSRVYAKVGAWSHEGFMDSLRAGETFVTNGPLLHLSANGQPIGAELTFSGDGPFAVKVNTGLYTRKPVKYVQIIQNGEVAHHLPVEEGQREVSLTHELTFTRSGWLAVRAGHDERDENNWDGFITAGHTSPIYVTVNGEPPAVAASAEYLIARVAATLEWVKNEALWSSDAYQAKAVAGVTEALEFYQAALARAK